jgi:hypothetical protein
LFSGEELLVSFGLLSFDPPVLLRPFSQLDLLVLLQALARFLSVTFAWQSFLLLSFVGRKLTVVDPVHRKVPFVCLGSSGAGLL